MPEITKKDLLNHPGLKYQIEHDNAGNPQINAGIAFYGYQACVIPVKEDTEEGILKAGDIALNRLLEELNLHGRQLT
jgi:hypothetical protein